MPILTLTAAIKLPMKNIAAAINKIGLRPQMSENLPQIGVLAALARRYADPIQVYPALEWKCSEIVGRAVVIMETSRAARKTAAQREVIITTVWRVVREASGSCDGFAGGEVAAAAFWLSLVMLGFSDDGS